ncbi:unnamed protein product, partial [Polarella glacialis]
MPPYGVELGLPTAEELVKIGQIRRACSAEIAALKDPAEDVCGDLRIVRFLRSRKGDQKTATDWFREFLTWRVTELAPGGTPEDWRREVVGRDIDDLRQWYLKRGSPFDPINPCIGENSDGMLLMWVGTGYVDPQKWAESHDSKYTVEHDFKTMMQVMEWIFWELTRRSQKTGKMAYMIKMLDLKGEGEDGRQTLFFGDKRFYDFTMKRVMPAGQHFYCDHDAMFLVVNAARLFAICWSMGKYLLTERQRSKFK